MTERTITSDEVRCPKCYKPKELFYPLRAYAAKELKCECGCRFVVEVKYNLYCTEVPND